MPYARLENSLVSLKHSCLWLLVWVCGLSSICRQASPAPSRACTARRRFTRWRTHLEWVCVKPSSHCTGDRQCARCSSASGLGRAHCAGPRTQDGIRVAPAISTLFRTVAQFQEPRHIGVNRVHYWTQPGTGDLVFHLDVAQMAMNCATFWVKSGAV